VHWRSIQRMSAEMLHSFFFVAAISTHCRHNSALAASCWRRRRLSRLTFTVRLLSSSGGRIAIGPIPATSTTSSSSPLAAAAPDACCCVSRSVPPLALLCAGGSTKLASSLTGEAAAPAGFAIVLGTVSAADPAAFILASHASVSQTSSRASADSDFGSMGTITYRHMHINVLSCTGHATLLAALHCSVERYLLKSCCMHCPRMIVKANFFSTTHKELSCMPADPFGFLVLSHRHVNAFNARNPVPPDSVGPACSC
jgi:hypothetical protein